MRSIVLVWPKPTRRSSSSKSRSRPCSGCASPRPASGRGCGPSKRRRNVPLAASQAVARVVSVEGAAHGARPNLTAKATSGRARLGRQPRHDLRRPRGRVERRRRRAATATAAEAPVPVPLQVGTRVERPLSAREQTVMHPGGNQSVFHRQAARKKTPRHETASRPGVVARALAPGADLVGRHLVETDPIEAARTETRSQLRRNR